MWIAILNGGLEHVGPFESELAAEAFAKKTNVGSYGVVELRPVSDYLKEPQTEKATTIMKRCPAISALRDKKEPTPEHMRACICELMRVVSDQEGKIKELTTHLTLRVEMDEGRHERRHFDSM